MWSGAGHAELLEEDVGHQPVVVLPGVDQRMPAIGEAPAQLADHGRHLDEVRPCADDVGDLHGAGRVAAWAGARQSRRSSWGAFAVPFVVIDTPPLTAVSDAFPLLRKVDGVIIVGRVGRNRRDVAQRLHETLTGASAPLLGVVANGFKAGRLGSYGYAYDYAYAGAERPPTAGVSPNGAATADEPVPTAKA